jgi:hypothetical protein
VGQERLGPSYFFISLVLGPLNSLFFFSRGLGRRMHLGVEVTESSPNKQHHLSRRLAVSGTNQQSGAAKRAQRINRRHDRHNHGNWRRQVAKWSDVKTEIVSAITNADFSYITKMCSVLFHFAVAPVTTAESKTTNLRSTSRKVMMSFICSCRNKK